MIEELLSVTLEEFQEQYLDKKSLLVSSSKTKTKNFDTANIKRHIKHERLSYPFVRLFKNGKAINEEDYINADTSMFEFKLVDNYRLLTQFKKGATIILQKAQTYFSSIKTISSSLQEELKADIQVNIYITPPGSKGFFPHFDNHDIIIMQVEGRKHWSLYDFPVKKPLKKLALKADERSEYLEKPPTERIVLEKGDVLFIPRGLVHYAYTGVEPSMHLTIGIHAITLVDVLNDFANSYPDEEALRNVFCEKNKNEVSKLVLQKLTKYLDQYKFNITPEVDLDSENWFQDDI